MAPAVLREREEIGTEWRMALIPYNVWPYAIADAVAAELYLWG